MPLPRKKQPLSREAALHKARRIDGAMRLVFFAVFLLVIWGTGCSGDTFFEDDLELAKTAYTQRNLPLAERLLERYLREEQNPEKRWEAWNLLLKAVNSDRTQPRASLECLDAMLVEYEDEPARLAEILPQIADYNQALRHFEQAADAWNSYLELGSLDAAQRAKGYRRLAAMQFAQRHYEAAEESLQQCLGLPLPDQEKTACLLDLAEENMLREHWQEVADLCQQILDAQPDRDTFGKACYLRGDALEQMGKPEVAARIFEKALDTYPNRLVIENRLAHLKKKDSK